MKPISLEDSLRILAKIEGDSTKLKSPDELAMEVYALAEFWRTHFTSNYMDGVDGAPDWLEFEHRLWQLGETLRKVIKVKKWKGKNALLDTIAEILCDPKFGKGRQTFALLLGDFGGREYGQSLGAVLNDSEVNGHSIKALCKAKINGYRIPVQAVLDSSKGWVRTAAKKYLSTVC